MKRRWKDGLVGLVIGILVVLAGNALVHRTDSEKNSGEDLSKAQEEQQSEIQQEEAKETRGFRITENMEMPQNFIEEMLLYQYIEYGVRKYNEDTNQNDRYSVDIEEDMLPYDTTFAMKASDQKPYKIDLAKEMIPELADNIYNFVLHGENGTKYMSIDTYNMKIYLYDIMVEKMCKSKQIYRVEENAEKNRSSNDIENLDIQQEIDDYMMHFTELYSTSAMDASNSLMNIEELEVALDDSGNMATLVKYSDTGNRYLRYRVDMYGETMNTVINYYLCDDFVLISKQNNYYSSQILTAGWNDVLHSEIDEWIIWKDRVYTFWENGRLEEIDKEQLEVPTVFEIESY